MRYPTLVMQSSKTDYDAKILEIEKNYFTNSDYNKFTNKIFDGNIKNKELVNKSDISKFINNSNLDKKIETLATKAVLKPEQEKMVKLETYDSSFFYQSYFFNDGSQNFLIFQPILNTFMMSAGLTETIAVWQSNGLSNEEIRPPTTPNNRLSPKLK